MNTKDQKIAETMSPVVEKLERREALAVRDLIERVASSLEHGSRWAQRALKDLEKSGAPVPVSLVVGLQDLWSELREQRDEVLRTANAIPPETREERSARYEAEEAERRARELVRLRAMVEEQEQTA